MLAAGPAGCPGVLKGMRHSTFPPSLSTVIRLRACQVQGRSADLGILVDPGQARASMCLPQPNPRQAGAVKLSQELVATEYSVGRTRHGGRPVLAVKGEAF